MDTLEEHVELVRKLKSVSNHLVNPDLLHAVLGICDEAGEIAKTIKDHIYYGDVLDKDNLMEEFGDLLWFVTLGVDSCGFTMKEVIQANMRKLKKRYADGFTEQEAVSENRDLEAEKEAMKTAQNDVGLKCCICGVNLVEGFCPDRGDEKHTKYLSE